MNEPPTLLHRLSDASWRILVVGSVIVVALWGLAYVKVVTIPVILAVFLTALLMPVCHWLRRRGLGRGPATAVSVIGAVVVLGGVVTLVVQPAISGFSGMVDSLVRAPEAVRSTLQAFGLDPMLLDSMLDSATQQAMTAIEQNRQQLVTGVWTAGAAALDVVVGFVLVIVLTIYFVHSGDKLVEWLSTLVPQNSRPGLRATGDTVYGVVGRYIRGVAGVGFIDAIGIGIPLLFIIDPGMVPTLVLLTFLGAFVPIVGAFVSGLLAALVALVTEGLVAALIVVAAVLIVQQLESNIFAPRIYGRALDLPSAVVLASVSAGAVIGGILGMFLATPVAAVVAALLRDRPFVVDERGGPDDAQTGASALSPEAAAPLDPAVAGLPSGTGPDQDGGGGSAAGGGAAGGSGSTKRPKRQRNKGANGKQADGKGSGSGEEPPGGKD
ncbi:AI-2E family transporter [Nocardiopsis coralliicola]